jgi:lipoate-protein ligase A
MDVKLVVDVPASGTWNMALDEALLEWGGQSQEVCLRFYQWSSPTLSLGYFQQRASRIQHAASSTLDVVRRASGGGAIIHDRELTYSLVFPVANRFGPRVQVAVRIVHESLVAVLGRLGISARLCDTPSARRQQDQPFLCFQRRAAEDVLVGQNKVAGSAQRRHRGAVLQHGSILLHRSEFASELPGIAQLAEMDVSLDGIRSALTEELARQWDCRFAAWRPPREFKERARWWQANRFAQDTWNAKR